MISTPSWLGNVPGTYQSTMDVVLSLKRWQFSLVPLAVLIILSRDADQNISHIRTILSLLQKASVTLNLKNCNLFTEWTNYLGHAILPGKLEVADHATDAVWDLSPRGNLAEPKLFLGWYNVYRQFVPIFTAIAALLNEELKKGQPRTFHTPTQEEHDTLVTLQDQLVSAQVVASQLSKGHLSLENDSCKWESRFCLDAKISKRNEKATQLFVNDARRSGPELQYNISRVFGGSMGYFVIKLILEGSKSTIHMDHDALKRTCIWGTLPVIELVGTSTYRNLNPMSCKELWLKTRRLKNFYDLRLVAWIPPC